jgi:hypothetical protein
LWIIEINSGGKVVRRILMGIVGVTFLLFCLAGQSMAIGFGGYLEVAGGDGEFEYEFGNEFGVDSGTASIGFVMDTDLADKGVFNYRLNVGYEEFDIEDNAGGSLELDGLVVANTFGFALIRKPDFRWWIGPQVRIGIYNGESRTNPWVDYDLFSFGFGGVTGVNFVTSSVTISPSFGILTTGFVGESNGYGNSVDFNGLMTTAFLNIAVLFGK